MKGLAAAERTVAERAGIFYDYLVTMEINIGKQILVVYRNRFEL